VGALKATRFGDGLLRIAAIIVALKADMRTAIRYIGGLTAYNDIHFKHNIYKPLEYKGF